jgi:hypothetical protein
VEFPSRPAGPVSAVVLRTAGFLGFTVIHIRRVVLHVFFFLAHRENRLGRVSVVSEMHKPRVTSFLLFASWKK